MKIEFKEKQKFTQWWFWLLLIGIGFFPVYGIYKQLILGEKFGNNPMPDIGLIILCFFIFALIAMFSLMRLKTEIEQKEIRMNFYPFVKRKVNWNEVKKAEIVNYGFVGGWGIRISKKYGIVYNMKGHKGLAIELKNGEKFLVGTQKEDELNNIAKERTVNKLCNNLEFLPRPKA